MWKSVPHTPARRIRTSASPTPGVGRGRSAISSRPGSTQSRARIPPPDPFIAGAYKGPIGPGVNLPLPPSGAGSDALPLPVGIGAAPAGDAFVRMLAGPLRTIRLRLHHTLHHRFVDRELPPRF